ncbi:hypothetical protein C0Q70_11089 [Pomacea canaliculata]|uniref:E3 ubiquitin-protein ligase HACE1 n=1 Tax=Pomacea canaliculata TaxID=400727 RepID=A0A2T7P512_POMCA|nr:hypothetical protein C0Q70_11089 [Pomacea canaliculata]
MLWDKAIYHGATVSATRGELRPLTTWLLSIYVLDLEYDDSEEIRMMAFLQKIAASLKRGRTAELPQDDKEAFYILMPMVIANQHRSVADLLSNSKFCVSFQCGRPQRSLLHVAANCGAYETLCLLLKKKAEVNLQDKSGFTPLHLAAKNGQRKCLNKLLEYECDINIRNNEGLTAVHWLAVNGRTELLQDMLSRIKDVNIEDAQGQTPLHVACQNGHLNTLRCLLDNGANVNKPNNNGWTPLHFACKHGQHEAVDALLKRGAELRPEDGGKTPLAICLEEGYGETCEVLLRQWPRLFDSMLQTACNVTISEDNVLKVLTYLCGRERGMKERVVEGLSERLSITGHHLLSNMSQEEGNTDSLIRVVRILLRAEKIQPTSPKPDVHDLLESHKENTHTQPLSDRLCLQMLWQQLEDILTLMDSELLHEDTTSDQPVKVYVDRNGENSVSEKLLAEKLCEVFSGDASLLACSVSSSTPTPKIEEKDKSGSFSPAVPRVCALIRAFYMCSQSNKNSSEKSSQFFAFFQRHIKTLKLFVERDPQLIFNHFHFLLSCPELMSNFLTIVHRQPFESRRQWFYENLPTPDMLSFASNEENHGLVRVNREQVFSTSCEEVLHQSPDKLKSTLTVQFNGEEGMGQGLVREWFDLLSRELLNPDYALFTMSADGCTFQPNSNSSINPDHLNYFRFTGRLLGLALFHRQLLATYFTRSFYKHILGIPVNYQDVASIDPEYAKNLQWLLDNDISNLGLDLTFSVETDVFGIMQEVELIPGGSKVAVNEVNKKEYVQFVTELRMTRAIKPQIDSFLSGFHDYIPHTLVQLFNEYELELLLSGMPEIDLADWKTNTTYSGYTHDSEIIHWFWDIVDHMKEQQRVQLLQFVTGSSRVPYGGFSQLPSGGSIQLFTISRQPCAATVPYPLPTTSTCINLLRLPEYPTLADLEDRLLTALRCGGQGYGLV